MWPFKSKKEVAAKESEFDCAVESAIDCAVNEIKKFRDVGETFNYLGRTCIVTTYGQYCPYLGVMPKIHCDYADDKGVIHSISFSIDELGNLIKQNEPNTLHKGRT
jgi:hypothetical protein